MSKPTAIVYVDGFNLYRRALENTPYRWLDIEVLSEIVLSQYDVIQVRYYTANISSVPNDPSQRQRQQIYLRALETKVKIVIHKGQFKSENKHLPVSPWEFDNDGKPRTVKVNKIKEKGSDVNLAAHLLLDAFTARAEAFFVLSSDSDFFEPMSIVKRLGLGTMGLILPSEVSSKRLVRVADPYVHHIRKGTLREAQFPDTILDLQGEIRKPSRW